VGDKSMLNYSDLSNDDAGPSDGSVLELKGRLPETSAIHHSKTLQCWSEMELWQQK
jgi:hypothetical protein